MSKANQLRFITKLLGRNSPVETVRYMTETQEDQNEVEELIKSLYIPELQPLHTLDHLEYLIHPLEKGLPPQFKSLDASQPWLCYWILNSLAVLGGDAQTYAGDVAEKIYSLCDADTGAFAGGFGQLPHVAATYAAVNVLAICKDAESIDIAKIYQWLLSLKTHNGGFKTTTGVGEVDTRGVYCALSVAKLLNIMTPELCEGVLEYLISCQTFEGGFGGAPGDEAHGGYTFCAVAALALLGWDSFEHVNMEKLAKWSSERQYIVEGGLSGRSNKLVDGCYSFWVGGIMPLFDILYDTEVLNREALERYILNYCQGDVGGLRDKPNMKPDYYHTNYVSMGLALTQYKFSAGESVLDIRAQAIRDTQLNEINPVFGIPVQAVEYMKSKFY